MKRTLRFLVELKKNNNREWFQAHREEYDYVRDYISALASQLIELVGREDPEAAYLTPRDCTYRIYRDVRFSLDKSPYKTHIGIFINPPGGKKSLTCGYYFHIEPENCFICAGTIGLPSPVMTRIRRSIYDEIDEYRSIVEDPAFRELLPNLGMEPLKTAPKGFDRNWEFIEYVRPRHFVASSDNLTPLFKAGKLTEAAPEYIRQIKRFNDFINYSIPEPD